MSRSRFYEEMKKEKPEFYIKRLWANCSSRCIVTRWKLIKEFIRFLRLPNRLVLEIGKENNYELEENQTFSYKDEIGDWELFTDFTGSYKK